jgi:hypothetical protein
MARARLASLRFAKGEHPDVIDQMVAERERRDQLLEDISADFAALRSDRVAWTEYQAELEELDGTLADGLEDD